MAPPGRCGLCGAELGARYYSDAPVDGARVDLCVECHARNFHSRKENPMKFVDRREPSYEIEAVKWTADQHSWPEIRRMAEAPGIPEADVVNRDGVLHVTTDAWPDVQVVPGQWAARDCSGMWCAMTDAELEQDFRLADDSPAEVVREIGDRADSPSFDAAAETMDEVTIEGLPFTLELTAPGRVPIDITKMVDGVAYYGEDDDGRARFTIHSAKLWERLTRR